MAVESDSAFRRTHREDFGDGVLGVFVGDILRLTEGSISPVACLDFHPEGCDRADGCLTLPLWRGLNKVMNEYLDSVTLQDILDHNINE